MKSKTKVKMKREFKSKQFKQCKYCKSPLYDSDITRGKKKYLEEKPGFWGGVEKPYEQFFDIHCSNSHV